MKELFSFAAGGDRVDAAHPERVEKADLECGVKDPRDHRHAGEKRRVDEHQAQGDEGHDAIDHGGDQALAEQVGDRRGRAEAGQYVADMALPEP